MPAKSKNRIKVRPRARRLKIKREHVANLDADLLRRVRADEGISRIDLARTLNLAPSTAGIYVDRLIDAGFLFERVKIRADFGRPPKSLSLNPNGGRFIGVDLEARNVMATAVDFSQNPLEQFHDTIQASDSIEKILAKIEHAIDEVTAVDVRPVLGIGVGVPGPVDSEKGVALHYRHIKGWENIPLVARLTKRYGVPVFLENNIRSMALAELWFGQGRGVENFICIGVRSGIGAGIILDGHTYRGSNNLAGEIADWPCWNGGSSPLLHLEDVASVRALQESATKGKLNNGASFSLKKFAEAVQAKDENATKIIDQTAQILGKVLTQLNVAFNPEKIIMAGAFTIFGELFLEQLKQSAQEFSASRLPLIVNSHLGEFNGALGAAALAVHEWKPQYQ